MVHSSILFVLSLTILDLAVGAPLQNDKPEPVDLNHFCFVAKEKENVDDKSPVLLIHGLGSSRSDWDGVYEVIALGTGRRVCAVDLRNHGDSPWNNRSDVEAMAEDIRHFIDQKKIQKVNVIGHSLGGKIAVHFTLKYPERVDSVVVEDMRPNGVNLAGYTLVKAAIRFLREALKTVPDGSNEDEAKTAIVNYIRQKFIDFGFDEKTEEIGNDMIAIHLVNGKWQYKVNWKLLEAAFDKPEEFLTPSTGVYEGPALFIYGTKSIFDVKGDEKNIKKLFPKAKLVPVEGAGHSIHRLFKEFNEQVIKLLNEKN